MFFRPGALFAFVGSFLTSTVDAHAKMVQPVPFGADTLTNAPLQADGSDYPCKVRTGVYDMGKMNNMVVGDPQALGFDGFAAVHEGGSCQISISLDKNPTANSVFKVIHSIEGGCPGVTKPEVFQFKVPMGFPNGEFALAWTWFNKASLLSSLFFEDTRLT